MYLSPSNPVPRALPPPEGGVSNPTPRELPPPKGGVLDSTKSAGSGSTTLYIGGGRRHIGNGVVAGQRTTSGVIVGWRTRSSFSRRILIRLDAKSEIGKP